VTRKIVVSLPDDLFREIEHARIRATKDRSAWIQEAASEYLKARTKEDVEAWLSADERVPPTDDEMSLLRWNAEHFGEMLGEDKPRRSKGHA
jgi:hypothetical protein